MKKLVAIMIFIFFAACLVPAFAADSTKAGSSSTGQQTPSVSIFQRASDSICNITKTGEQTAKDATRYTAGMFQETHDAIQAGSPDAKSLSLRGQKSEIERRRGKP